MIMSEETFTLNLAAGVNITARFNMDRIASLPRLTPLGPGAVSVSRHGNLSERHMPAYIAWILDVGQHVATKANKCVVMLVTLSRHRGLLCHFEPGLQAESFLISL